MQFNVKNIFKLLIGISLISLLLFQVKIDEVLNVFKSVRMSYLYYGILFFVLASISEVFKLHVLIHKICNLYSTLKIVYIGLFINNFLPSNIGGDTYKVYLLKKINNNLGAAIVSILLDRVVGLVVLIVSGFVYLIVNLSEMYEGFILLGFDLKINTALWAILILVVIVISIAYLMRVSSDKFINAKAKFSELIIQARQGLSNVTSIEVSLLIILSISFHLCRLFGIYYFILCFNESIVWTALILVLAVVAVISVLPISIGALGVREGAFVIMLSFFGVESSVAVAVALMVLLIIWLKSLVGGVFFIITTH